MPDAGQRYWAFLSYSHQDRRWAGWLRRGLENWTVPSRMVGIQTPAGCAPRRFRPVFRDREELAASAQLGEPIRDALRDSAWLIVICSPAAARSAWVSEEISQFKLLHGEERVLAVIVAGEPFASDHPGAAAGECFPKALTSPLRADKEGGTRIEPAAADARPGKDGRRGALLKLLSGMLGVSLDQLVRREARRRQQRLLILTAASLALSAVMAVLAITAFIERNEARAQRVQAEGLVEFMIGDLAKTLAPSGRLDALDAIGGRAMSYYAAQRSHGLDAASLGRRARVLHLLGEIRRQRGDLPGAMAFFSEAAKSTGELLARDPTDTRRMFDDAQSAFYLGYVAFQRGEDDIARQHLERYKALTERLVEIGPKNEDWRAEASEADMDLGSLMYREGHGDEAAADLDRALAISRDLAARAPQRRDRQRDVAQILAWLADTEVLRGNLDAAMADRTAEAAIYAHLLSRIPSDSESAVDLASSRTAIAKIRLAQGSTAAAIADLNSAAADMGRLIAGAPDNVSYKANAVATFLLLGQTLLDQGRLDAAQAIARHALEISEAQAIRGQAITWSGTALGGARILLIEIAASRAPSAAARKEVLRPALVESARLAALANAHPKNVRLARLASEAGMLAGDFQSLDHRPAEARSTWTAAIAPLERAGLASLPPTDRGRMVLRQLFHRLRFGVPPARSLAGVQAGGTRRLRVVTAPMPP
jgi:tetratricopeptide (TPR) repeat protein